MKMTTRIRCYTDLSRIHDFRERYEYLKLRAEVGVATFGFERYMNQRFYTSTQWRSVRSQVIARDNGCDLGFRGHEIYDRVIIHHMNPMTADDIAGDNEAILDPEFLISVTHGTHNAVHYGDADLLVKPLIARRPGDTKLW